MIEEGCEGGEKTNGQGAGHTAGAGRERRPSDVIYEGMVVGEKGDLSNRRRGGGEQDEEMEEGEDLRGVQPT